MSQILFESPLKLAVLVFLPVVVTSWVWFVRQTPRSRNAMLATMALGAALFGLQAAVVTQREVLIDLCHKLATMTEEGNIDGIGRCLDETFQAEGLDRAAMLTRIERALHQYRPEESRLSGFDFTFDGEDRATVTFNVFCRISTGQMIEHGVPSRWRLTLLRRPAGWRVNCIEALPTALSPIGSLRDIP